MKKQIAQIIIGIICLVSVAGAQSWHVVKSPVTDLITGISFIHPDTGFIVTGTGWFARTYDGAKTWKATEIAFGARFEDVSFINSSIGLICGLQGALYRTTDGGATWKNVSPEDSLVMFYDVELLDPQTALVIGMDRSDTIPYAGIAYRSTDGGKTWKKQKRLGLGYSEIFYKPGGDVFFISFGQIHRSHDKGKTWQTFKTTTNSRARSLSLYGKRGLMAGPAGMCAVSSDSGKTWENVEQDKEINFIAAELIDEQTGYIGGLNAKMFVTADGGKTWQQELLARTFSVLDMCTIGNRLYAVGSGGGIIYKEVK